MDFDGTTTTDEPWALSPDSKELIATRTDESLADGFDAGFTSGLREAERLALGRAVARLVQAGLTEPDARQSLSIRF